MRHGQSEGNVARNIAIANASPTIQIAWQERDVPLSSVGKTQSEALGQWLGANATKPAVMVLSPFVRARDTGDIAARSAGWNDVPIVLDERFREKELGLLDRLTSSGIAAQYPQEALMRASLGKFYYRPPRGESWADVVLRLRSALETIRADYHGQRVMIVTHQVVVLCLRYIIEHLSEEQLLDIDRSAEVANCSLTTYRRVDIPNQAMTLTAYNFVAPLEETGVPVTSSADAAKE
ncbi:MAG: histidine phosphatase family protein [Vulcanimicrobiaceae bacterium]